MKKSITLAALITLSGCANHAYKPQTVTMRGNHTLVLHEGQTAMENAYEKVWLNISDKTEKKERGDYSGFFDPATNISHCFTPYPESCMLHEYKHLLVKYGLIVPNDPHFKRKNSKIRIIKWR